MLRRVLLLVFVSIFSMAYAATFGTVVPVVGGASDIVLDEARERLYLPNTNANRVEIYSIAQRRFLTPITVEAQPLAAAMSRNGRILYVTCHTGNSVNEIDLDRLAVVNRVSLPARPEGVAVGGDERVLISTVGTGQGNLFNVLLVYDPNAPAGTPAVSAVPVAPAPPANPLLPPNNFGRGGLTNRSFLQATRDGRYIIGVNIPNAASRAVFVYESESAVVLRSRTVANVSSVLSVAPDGKTFMAGLNLFDTDTLTILAQQNAANAPYPFPTGTNFNLQQNQGGSVFAPDGSRLYSAFNFTPVQNPPSRANVAQLMINDPQNLLIETALQMAENIAGKMVISRDGANLYALSESGFLIVPVGQANQNPIAALAAKSVVLLANDQCGTVASQNTGRVDVRNAGRGRLTASLALLQQAPAGPGGLGGAGGAGGGAPGGGLIIVIPGIPPGGQNPNLPPAQIPGVGNVGGQNNNIAFSAPRSRSSLTADGAMLEFSYNPVNQGLGTVSPTHQFVVQSNEAINIPPAVTVFQNNRNSEARGDIVPIEVGLSANEGLVDMVHDTNRQRLYIANSAMNKVEVYDIRTRQMLAPVKVGQLPRSLALSPDGQTLYVANTGGESISVVDTQTMQVVGRLRFPAVPFNATTALITPQAIAATQRGALVMMSNGTIWRIVGNDIVPVRFNTGVIPVANGLQAIAAPRTMAASPNGEVVLVLGGNGFAYLYDSNLDDFVQSRQVVTAPIQGYFGPLGVGPRGQFFLVNGLVLNQSLTPIGTAGTTAAPGPGGAGGGAGGVVTAGGATTNRPVAAVAPVGLTQLARFVPPVVQNANQLAQLQQSPTVEIADVNTGLVLRSVPALERPLQTATGNQRANVNGRTMAVDATGNTAYLLTASGLSVIPLDIPTVQNRPQVNPNGVVNLASLQTNIAQGGLISIFGRNLARNESASTNLPTQLGGACVTLGNRPLPLSLSSGGQINAQIPPDVAPGRYQITVRNLDVKVAANPSQLTVAKYGPAVIVDPESKQTQIFHADGKPITKDNPAKRDRPIHLFAVGLGPTKGGRVVAGQPSPSEPLAVTDLVKVFFGNPTINGSEIIVDWSGLVPGMVGIYRIDLRVPGNHLRGELPITLRLGSVNSPTTGPVVPTVFVD